MAAPTECIAPRLSHCAALIFLLDQGERVRHREKPKLAIMDEWEQARDPRSDKNMGLMCASCTYWPCRGPMNSGTNTNVFIMTCSQTKQLHMQRAERDAKAKAAIELTRRALAEARCPITLQVLPYQRNYVEVFSVGVPQPEGRKASKKSNKTGPRKVKHKVRR